MCVCVCVCMMVCVNTCTCYFTFLSSMYLFSFFIGNHMLIFQLSFSLYILYFVVVSIEGLMED